MAKAKKKVTENFDLTAVEQVRQRDLADAEQIRAELLAQLATGRNVQDDLDTVDAEIAGHERALARIAEARFAAAQSHTASAKQAKHAQTIGNLERALEEAERLSAMATEALLTVAELEGCLAAIDEQRATVHVLLHDALHDTSRGAPSERVSDDTGAAIRRAVHALCLPHPFAQALWRAGVGRKGITVPDDFVQIRPVRGDYSNPIPGIEDALAKLAALAENISQWSAKANDVKEAA